mgnify:CR=1 FL=1
MPLDYLFEDVGISTPIAPCGSAASFFLLPLSSSTAFLRAAGMVGKRRYRLSRSSLRSIRFSFRGPLLHFLELYIGGYYLTFMTLRWAVLRNSRFTVNHLTVEGDIDFARIAQEYQPASGEGFAEAMNLE